MALGITNSIAANGETAITANLQMSGYKHTSVSDAVLRNQYASAGQVQDSTLQWGSTATGTADALAITLAPVVTAYVTGQRFPFISGAAANTTTTPTLAVNGLAAKTFVHKDGTALVAGDIAASTLYEAIYDGTNMRINTAGARGAGNAASAGANSDITSLSGLTTALSIAQGGTGATAANAAADALGAFRKGTILGTVSQTSGVPTGAIIETVTNANGTYTRWADGTQICTYTDTGNPAISVPASSEVTSALFPFPAGFTSIHYSEAEGYLTDTAGSRLLGFLNASLLTTTSGWKFVAKNSDTTIAATRLATLNMVATGRWF